MFLVRFRSAWLQKYLIPPRLGYIWNISLFVALLSPKFLSRATEPAKGGSQLQEFLTACRPYASEYEILSNRGIHSWNVHNGMIRNVNMNISICKPKRTHFFPFSNLNDGRLSARHLLTCLPLPNSHISKVFPGTNPLHRYMTLLLIFPFILFRPPLLLFRFYLVQKIPPFPAFSRYYLIMIRPEQKKIDSMMELKSSTMRFSRKILSFRMVMPIPPFSFYRGLITSRPIEDSMVTRKSSSSSHSALTSSSYRSACSYSRSLN